MKYYTRIALFVLALVTIAFSGVLQAGIYRWEDAEGNTHFTDDLTRVPPSHREGAEVEALPEETANVTPAAPPPADGASADPPEEVDTYSECVKKVQEQKERWTKQLEEDEDRLVELNRMIHRATTSRDKNSYQRERVAVKERIVQSEQALSEKVPPMERECESIRYWQGEE